MSLFVLRNKLIILIENKNMIITGGMERRYSKLIRSTQLSTWISDKVAFLHNVGLILDVVMCFSPHDKNHGRYY